VHFFGTWDGAEQALLGMNGMPLEVALTQSLEPGKGVILKVNFAQSYNSRDRLPSQVRVVVDPEGGGKAERCRARVSRKQ